MKKIFLLALLGVGLMGAKGCPQPVAPAKTVPVQIIVTVPTEEMGP